jgi:hypothetical protein
VNGLSWSSVVRGLAWVLAISFFLSTVLTALLGFEVFGPPPERGEDFIQFILDLFRWDYNLWPIDFAASALAAIGFLALGALGPAFRRLTGPEDGRRGLVATSFLSAGLLGAASELVWIGAKPIAVSPQYCDCGFLQEEIMSRLMIRNVVGGVRDWLLNGFLVLLALGLVIVAGLGQRAGMPSGWRRLSIVIAALSLVGVAMTFFEVGPFGALLFLLIGGVLAPIWALWLASRASVLWPETARMAKASMPPD